MDTSAARKVLQHYFAAKKELDDQHKRGEIDNLHYQLKANHYIEKMGAVKIGGDIAKAAFYRANRLCTIDFYITGREHKALEKLREYDYTTYKALVDKWKERHLEHLCYSVLDMFDGITIPEIPEPSPEKVKQHDEARNHRLGVTVTTHGARGGGGAGGWGGMGGGNADNGAGRCTIYTTGSGGNGSNHSYDQSDAD